MSTSSSLRKPQLKLHDRRYSWPPFKLTLSQRKKDIDEDPFSFFVSPPDDAVEELASHLDADIEPQSRTRSLSPRIANNKDKLLHSPAIRRLRRWVQMMEARYLHVQRRTPSASAVSLPTPPQSPVIVISGSKRPASEDIIATPDEAMFDVYDVSVSPPLRGRNRTRTSRRKYGDKMVRSHSKRARVWKEPDEDIWSVKEEPEEIGLGIRI